MCIRDSYDKCIGCRMCMSACPYTGVRSFNWEEPKHAIGHATVSYTHLDVYKRQKLNRVVGPGLYFTIPVIEHGTIRVDQRTIATPFYAEKTLTADLVPVTVDAVLFWVVWDAEKACTEVEDYYAAVSFLAQTAPVSYTHLDELSKYGTVTYKRIYGDWTLTLQDVYKRQVRARVPPPIALLTLRCFPGCRAEGPAPSL